MRGWMVAVGVVCSSITLALTLAFAQSDLRKPGQEQYVPQLGDLMDAAQARHMKLWFAGKGGNWELAAFELGRLRASLADAAVLYSGIPVSNVTTLVEPLNSVSDAINAKDSKAFAKAVADLTEGCNSCHRSMERSFIVMKVPPQPQPFGDQVFSPVQNREPHGGNPVAGKNR